MPAVGEEGVPTDMEADDSIVARLGARPVINAHSRLTRLGGSVMPPVVWEAMQEASTTFFDMWELQDRVGDQIADLTRNEAAYVTSGSAAGLVLATAACIIGTDPALIARLPHIQGLKDQVVIHRFQRNHYDNNVRTAGAQLVEIGSHRLTHPWELEAALGPRTAAVIYFVGPYEAENILPLERVIEIAGKGEVPVIVDAAGQLPPSSNLSHYTRMGAALAIFSGGKALGGPQNSGIILGRKDLIAACKLMGSPNYALGRPFKVGREEMVGLLAALEHYLETGERDQREWCERAATYFVSRLMQLPGFHAYRRFPNEHLQDLPDVVLEFDESGLGVTRNDIVKRLRDGNPRIEVAGFGKRGILLNPDTLQAGELDVVVDRLKIAAEIP